MLRNKKTDRLIHNMTDENITVSDHKAMISSTIAKSVFGMLKTQSHMLPSLDDTRSNQAHSKP